MQQYGIIEVWQQGDLLVLSEEGKASQFPAIAGLGNGPFEFLGKNRRANRAYIKDGKRVREVPVRYMQVKIDEA